MARRTKIGLLVPSNNCAIEPDFWRVMPPDVTVHSERMWNNPRSEPSDGPEHLEELNSDVDRSVRYVARSQPDVIVYGCTSGSFWQGLEYDEKLKNRLKEIAGAPVVTTSASALDALRHLGVRKLSVASPYGDWVNERLAAFLQKAGFEVLSVRGEPFLKHSVVEEISNQDPDDIRRFVETVVAPGSEGVFLSCTAWRAMEAVNRLEQDLGVPVITSNQATIWRTFQTLGRAPREGGAGGRLLGSLAAPAEASTLSAVAAAE